MMNKRFVVTGAAGFIGHHLCETLLSRFDCTVIGIDNERSGDWSRVSQHVEQLSFDISELTVSQWRDILQPDDVVFHLAAEKYNSSKTTPERVFACNVLGTEKMIRAAAEIGISRLVFTSSLYAYGSLGPEMMSENDKLQPRTLYGASKSIGEDFLRTYSAEKGLSYNVARLFFIYGPNQFAQGGYKSVILMNFERILKGEPPLVFGDGQQELDYVYIDDCVESLIELSDSSLSGEIVNIASGSGVSIKNLTSKMLKIAETTIDPKFGPADWTANTKRIGSPDRMQEKFGWSASTPLEKGLSEVWKWMKSSK